MAGPNTTESTDADRAAAGDLPEPPVYVDPYSDRVRERTKNHAYYGVMFAGEYEWTNQRCTAEAYGEYDPTARPGDRRKSIDGRPRRSLKFHTTWMDVAEAVECVKEIHEYNKFMPALVVRFLEDHLPPTAQIVVGRESSPVMYFWTVRPEYVMRQLAGMRPQPDDPFSTPSWASDAAPDELGAVTHADAYPMQTVGQPRDAPEVGEGVPTLIRAWWD